MSLNETKNKLIILAGATAVGKSELSIKLAKKINGEIISADSMQVYKGLDIGTAKISADEMDGVKHYLIDVLEPNDDFNVFEFQKLAKDAMNEIYSKGKIPILVGGTGFYIQALLYDIDFSEEETSKEYRKELEEMAKEKGAEFLHEMLKEVDPNAASEIHPNNVKRVIRALEFYHDTGRMISEHNIEQRQKESPYDFTYIVLNRSRDVIYERINKRVDLMEKAGLIDEVKDLLSKGARKDSISMQGLGYKETIEFLDGLVSKEEAMENLKKNTRHFAKRQITWFKRENDAIWMNYEDYENVDAMVDEIVSLI